MPTRFSCSINIEKRTGLKRSRSLPGPPYLKPEPMVQSKAEQNLVAGRTSVPETFVLVHGGSLGAWSSAAVIAQLQRLAHRAIAVDLAGRGESPYDLAKVTLAVHIDTVSRYIEERDLRDVVMVGHSMAGLIIPNVAVRMPDRIKRLIFVSALVMRDGESATEVFKPIGEAAAKR